MGPATEAACNPKCLLNCDQIFNVCATTGFGDVMKLFPDIGRGAQTKDVRANLVHASSPFTHTGIDCESQADTQCMIF